MPNTPKKVKPTTPISEREELAGEVADRVRANRADLLEHFGDRPWGGEKLTAAEQLESFREVRDNPAFWQDRIQRATGVLKLSPDRLPRELIEEAMEFEAKHKKEQGGG